MNDLKKELVKYSKKEEKISVQIQDRPHNMDELHYLFDNFKIKQSNDMVKTMLLDQTIYEKKFSDKYEIFDFSAFGKKHIDAICKEMKPISYSMKLESGVQQLKLKTNSVERDGEIYSPVFTLFSSTNGYYQLIICMGLFRQICSNGMVIPINSNQFNLKTRHYTDSVLAASEAFSHKIEFMEDEFEQQIQFIHNYKSKEISLLDLVRKLRMTFPRVHADKAEGLEFDKLIHKFTRNLQYSHTDSLDRKSLSEGQFNTLYKIDKAIKSPNKYDDIILNQYSALNCYTELFNRSNQSRIHTESERIINILNQ